MRAHAVEAVVEALDLDGVLGPGDGLALEHPDAVLGADAAGPREDLLVDDLRELGGVLPQGRVVPGRAGEVVVQVASPTCP